MSKTNVSGTAQKEMDKVADQFDNFKKQVDALTLDRMNEAPKGESLPQAEISQKQIAKDGITYLKPVRIISSKEKFNEAFRSDFNYMSERVNFTAQNNELIGAKIETWTKKFPGQPAEYWEVPCNKPVNGPRYLAERIKECTYHRLVMDESRPVSADGSGTYLGAMIADTTMQRLDAFPLNERKSVFMGASGF